MSDPRFVSLITMLGSVLAALIGLLNTFVSHKREQRNQQTRIDVQQLKENTNGISDHLVKLTGESEFARGLKQGEDHPLPPKGAGGRPF